MVDKSVEIERARVFDQKLLEVRRKVCEPSRLGGGVKARMAIKTIKSEAESLLERVSKLVDTRKTDNGTKVNNISDIQNWMEEVSSEIEPLEAKGREAGLIRTNGIEESENVDTSYENGKDKNRTLLSSDSLEYSLHPGRKSSISRRLFESPATSSI